MTIRGMRFEALQEPDHSNELKQALREGIDAFRATGRVVTAEMANKAVRAVELALLEKSGASAGPKSGQPKVIRRSRYAKWSEDDFQALSELNWPVLDPLWERVEAGEVTVDEELTQQQQQTIERGYRKVPGDARTERWPESQLISKLRYLVKAFKHAEQRNLVAS